MSEYSLWGDSYRQLKSFSFSTEFLDVPLLLLFMLRTIRHSFLSECLPYLQKHSCYRSARGSYFSLRVSWCADRVKSDPSRAVLESANPALLCCSRARFRGRARSFMISYCWVFKLPAAYMNLIASTKRIYWMSNKGVLLRVGRRCSLLCFKNQ